MSAKRRCRASSIRSMEAANSPLRTHRIGDPLRKRPCPTEYWEAPSGGPARRWRPWPPIQQRRLSEIPRELLRVECGRCSRCVEIQRFYGRSSLRRRRCRSNLATCCASAFDILSFGDRVPELLPRQPLDGFYGAGGTMPSKEFELLILERVRGLEELLNSSRARDGSRGCPANRSREGSGRVPRTHGRSSPSCPDFCSTSRIPTGLHRSTTPG